MAERKEIGTDFTQGPIMPLMVRFALPLMLANILSNLYNTVDMIILGQFAGNIGTAAITTGGKMLNVYTMVAMGFASAGQICIAQSMGSKNKQDVNSIIGTLLSVLLISSICLAVITWLLSETIIIWMNTPEDIYSSALAYLRITSIGLPLIYGYEAVSSILRGMGNSKAPLIFVSIATGINIVLDVIFIAIFQMGAAGTALATVIGQGVSLVCSICYLYREKESFGFDFRPESFRINGRILKILLRLGIPMAASNGLIQVSQVVMMSFINVYGVVQIAAYGIGEKILIFSQVFINAFSTSGGSMAAQNIGAGKHERVRRVVRYTLMIGLAISVVLAIVCLPFPRALFAIFTKDQEVMVYAPVFVQISVLLFFLSSVQGAYQTVVNGTGNAKLSLLGSFIDSVLLRIGLGLLFGRYFGMEVTGFFLGTVLARLGPISIGVIYYYSNRWTSYRKLTETSKKEAAE